MDNGNGITYHINDIVEFKHKNKILIGKFIKINKETPYIIHIQTNKKLIYNL